MKTIFLSHAIGMNYKNNLYLPIRCSKINTQYNFILPHETDEHIKTKEIIKNCDLFILEFSYPGTGVGLEMGWADAFKKPVVAIVEDAITPKSFISLVCNHIYKYKSANDMLIILENILKVPDYSVYTFTDN